mgnify:CR=1 FL=1
MENKEIVIPEKIIESAKRIVNSIKLPQIKHLLGNPLN